MDKVVIDDVVKVGHYTWWWCQVGRGDSSTEVMMGVDVISLPEMILLLNQRRPVPGEKPYRGIWKLRVSSGLPHTMSGWVVS